jgi:hypothetical protein
MWGRLIGERLPTLDQAVDGPDYPEVVTARPRRKRDRFAGRRGPHTVKHVSLSQFVACQKASFNPWIVFRCRDYSVTPSSTNMHLLPIISAIIGRKPAQAAQRSAGD